MAASVAQSEKTANHRRPKVSASTGSSSFYVPQRVYGFSVIDQAREGVSAQQVDQLATLLGLSLKEMAVILQIAERTLHRYRQEGRLDSYSSERLLLLESLAAHGLAVFDNQADAFASWLRYPLRELKQQAPIQILNTISGFGLVDDVLTRIEYGVYS